MIALLLALTSPADAAPATYWSLSRAVEKGKHRRLVKLLGHRRSYVRQLAARGLRGMTLAKGPATPALRACVKDEGERAFVRAECAMTLGAWKVEDAAPELIEAIGQVGPEARYWMALALRDLNTVEARAELANLANDSDIFVSSAAREWTR